MSTLSVAADDVLAAGPREERLGWPLVRRDLELVLYLGILLFVVMQLAVVRSLGRRGS